MLLDSLLFGLKYTQEDKDRLIRVETTKLDVIEKKKNQRFVQIDKKFKQIEKNIGRTQTNINQNISSLLSSIFALVGLDRRATINQVKLKIKEEIKCELKKEADKKVDSYKLQKLNKLFSIIKKMVKNGPKTKKTIECHYLKLV